ncbi:MAG TPA: photosynthetic reaction center subunit H, partial [Sphingomonas sp.]
MQLAGDGAPALVPIFMAKVDRRRRRVVVDALNAAQFAGVPRLDAPNQITLYEEERVQAYFGGGYLYANADRQEPFL